MKHAHDSFVSHDATRHDIAGHGTMKGYMIGFVLSLILTVIPFVMVMTDMLSTRGLIISVVLFALVQLVVHFIYFLHMHKHSEDVWNLIAFAFTLLIIVIVVGGSLWIMYNLNINMMPS